MGAWAALGSAFLRLSAASATHFVVPGLTFFLGFTGVVSGAAQDLVVGWSTADGGGGELTGTHYTLRATAGQPDASSLLSASGFDLVGGYWVGASSSVSLARLSLTKDDRDDPVPAGVAVIYDLTVTNGGPATAPWVRVTDDLPEGSTLSELDG